MFRKTRLTLLFVAISLGHFAESRACPQLNPAGELPTAIISYGAIRGASMNRISTSTGYQLAPRNRNDLPVSAAANRQAQEPIISTVAGPLLPYNGARATTQAIDHPKSVAVESGGTFYVSSAAHNRVYRITSDGTLTLFAGSSYGYGGDGGTATAAQLSDPHGIALDAAGNLYIADTANHRIRKVTPAGVISTVAGTESAGYSGDGGAATLAELNWPHGIAVDAAGNFYIADTGNHCIRKVTSAGIITTVAGNGTEGFYGDGGPATSAMLAYPFGVTVDAAGNLYIADSNNQRIRKVTSAGIIGTVAGSGIQGFGGDGGAATAAQLNNPYGIAVDVAGNLYIADTDNNSIRKVTAGGVISTVAGDSNSGFGGDGGAATSAQLFNPLAVAVDPAGNLYIADTENHRVRKVTAAGVISTVAGIGIHGFSGDGGAATAAHLSWPNGVTLDSAGNLYIADSENHRIRMVTAGGIIITIAGNGHYGFSGDGGAATAAEFRLPSSVAVNNAGDLYIADTRNHRIRMVTAGGIIRTVAGNGIEGFGGDGGLATAAQLNHPNSVTVDAQNSVYITDGGNQRIRRVTASGIISTVAGNGTQGSDGDGGLAISAQLFNPVGIAVDTMGNIYIADTSNQRIRKVTVGGVISTVAGNGMRGFSGDGGPAISAELSNPFGVAVDTMGNLYIADTGNYHIRKVTTGGVISSVAGNGNDGFSGDGGPATLAQFGDAQGIALHAVSNIYISDTSNHRIRLVTSGTAPGTATLISPSGDITTSTPTYTWTAVPLAAAYLLWVKDTSATPKIQRWYTAEQAGCASGSGSCSVTPSTELAAGACQWWIQTRNAAGDGPWSSAMSFAVTAGAPGKATLISPSGTISTATPSYTWNAVPGSTWYYLWVNDSTSQGKIDQWYKAADAGCASGTGICTATPSTALAGGSCQWWIQTWSDSGIGPWSDAMSFTVQLSSPPGKATLIAPSGTISSNSPTYTWNAVSTASWYLLYVSDSKTQAKINQWYKSADAGCGSGTGTCAVMPGATLAAGACLWWIQTWNDAGYGPWSDALSFVVPGGSPPGKAILVSPSGTIPAASPTYSWESVQAASWYLLRVVDSANQVRISQWYKAADAGCESGQGTCNARPSTSLTGGTYQWWIQTYNEAGYGPWSDALSFVVGAFSFP